MKEIKLTVKSIGGTSKLASQIAKNLKGGEVICLIGELGVGKTYFVKSFAEALGILGEEVISPTFVYWRKHKGDKFMLNHFDFYRIENNRDIHEIGLEEAFEEKNAVTIIEWADRAAEILPGDRLEIHIKYLGESERQIILQVYGEKYDYLIKGVKVES
jgi:tRNA threonylcarbamoyladenosine biosynthesis protein TsaE